MVETDFNKLSRELSGKSGFAGSFLLFLIIALIVILLVWANVTELDNVTRGTGKIVSSTQNQMVQTSERGVLKATYVDKGQQVKKDDLLYEIDPIEAKADLELMQRRFASLEIQKERLLSEISGVDPDFRDDLTEFSPNVVSSEMALFLARRADLSAQISVLEQQRAQSEQQIKEINVLINTAVDTLSLVNEQISIIKPLVEANLAPETDLLALRRQEKDFEGKRDSAAASLVRSESSLREIEDKIKAAFQSFTTKSQGELAKVITEIAEIESKIPAMENRVVRTQIRSPVDGIINQVNFTTLGGFLNTGDVVAEIVPIGDDLIVEGQIDPKDIAYIKPDQDVRISLTAYDASRYGTIDGKVLKVSADAVLDTQLNTSMYVVEVSMDSYLFEDDGTQVEVLPGMVASIDVLAGKRTILEYFWRPMVKVKERAFRD